MTFRLLQERLDDYGGAIPFPGLWGLLGTDLIDDQNPNAAGPEDRGSATNFESNELPALSASLRCPYCQAVQSKPDVKYCSECGKAVAPPRTRAST